MLDQCVREQATRRSRGRRQRRRRERWERRLHRGGRRRCGKRRTRCIALQEASATAEEAGCSFDDDGKQTWRSLADPGEGEARDMAGDAMMTPQCVAKWALDTAEEALLAAMGGRAARIVLCTYAQCQLATLRNLTRDASVTASYIEQRQAGGSAVGEYLASRTGGGYCGTRR